MATAVAPLDDLREPPVTLPADQTGLSRKQALDLTFDAAWDNMRAWRTRWLTIGSAMLPSRPRWCIDTTSATEVPASYATMMDPVALLAGRTTSSGLSTKLSNPQSKWFGLTTTDPELDAADDVERWMADTVAVIFAAYDRSNFYAAAEQVYMDCVFFSNAAMDIQPDRQTDIRCFTHPIGSYGIGRNLRGRVNTFARKWQDNAFNILREYGDKNLHPDLKQALGQRDRSNKFTIRHLVYPNDEANAEYAAYDNTRMPFRECYWLESDERQDFYPLAEGYFAEWPIPCPHWGPLQDGGVWGSLSPGFIALPDVLMLYSMKLAYLKGLNKKVDPVTVSGSAWRNKKVWSTPGANNVDDQSQGDPQLRAAYLVQLELQHVSAEMELIRQQIRQAFYADIMLPMLLRLQTENEQPTALQAGLARDEQYGALGPIIEGFSDNFHDVCVDRTFGILWRAGKIAPPPERLRGKPLRVVLHSAMAQAQQAVGVAALERHLQFSGAVASMWGANALDNTDPDKLVKKYDQLIGVDPDVRRPDAERDAIREQRVAAQRAALAAQQMPAAAKAMRDMSETKVGDQNALERVASAAGVN